MARSMLYFIPAMQKARKPAKPLASVAPNLPSTFPPSELPRPGLWLAHLLLDSLAQYTDHKSARDRSPQTGQAWRGLLQTFDPKRPGEFAALLLDLVRLVENRTPPFNLLSSAYACLAIEHEVTNELFGVSTPDLSDQPVEAALLVQRTLQRWCDWLDVEIHLSTHRFWHQAPACFDPDPEKRDLAILGTTQRHFAHQTDYTKNLWSKLHALLAQHFAVSPKWKTLGEAMASQAERSWPYPELDTAIISLWPLLKKHNWTYRDLMHVVSSLRSLSQPSTNNTSSRRSQTKADQPSTNNPQQSYPCDSEQSFATYCVNVLGLRKTTKGVTARTGHPPGYEIAKRLFPPTRK
jgi:hypothetical protein